MEFRTQTDGLGSQVVSPLLQREAREAAHRWLARFAPLLEATAPLTSEQCRKRLATVEELRPEGARLVDELREMAGPEDAELLETLQSAHQELEQREEELRESLALLSPGDPGGRVNLPDLRSKLAEAAARREVEEVAPGTALSGVLELETAPATPAAAFGAGLFATAWLSFTTVHAILMIGGMMRAIGLLALALLAFYALFFGVGLLMVHMAWRASCRETVSLVGRRLTLRRANRLRTWERVYEVKGGAMARIEKMAVKEKGKPGRELTLAVVGGTEIRFASNRPAEVLKELRDQINAHLRGA